MAENHQWTLKSLRMPLRMLVKCSTSQWRKMDAHPRSPGDNDEALSSISTENISGLRNCWELIVWN